MQGKYLVADARDAASVSSISRAITTWEPLLSLKCRHGESLYEGVSTGYGLSIGEPSVLTFRQRQQRVETGDAVVLVPAVRVTAAPAAGFLWICYEGLSPQHLRGPAGLQVGFEHFPLRAVPENPSVCGLRREVLPDSDLRYRVQYHFVEIHDPQPHTHADMVELYYVLSGSGAVRVGPAMDQLTAVPVRAGSILAVGPGLYHLASDGLGMCIWFLYSELAHRRRVREAMTS